MNLRDLQYIVAVADLRNFRQAAEQCFVSQPGLSYQIKKLEAMLDVQLFERTNKRVMPTEIGEQIIHYARRVLREIDTIKEIAENSHDPLSGKLRLGAFPTISPYIFPSLVSKIRKSMPKLKIILVEEKTHILVDKLKNGELDAAILALPIIDDYLVDEILFEDEFYLAVSSKHSLSKQKKINQQELTKHKLLLLEEGHCLRNQALDICQKNIIEEEQDFRATGLETLRQMVKAGSGITLIPKIAITQVENDISYIPFMPPVPHRTIGLVWRKTCARKILMNKLIKLIKELGYD